MRGFETVYFGRYLLFRRSTEVADGFQTNRADAIRPKGASAKPVVVCEARHISGIEVFSAKRPT